MKNAILTILAAFFFGCGAPSEDLFSEATDAGSIVDEEIIACGPHPDGDHHEEPAAEPISELGTAEQAIFVPATYGWEAGPDENGMLAPRCSGAWTGHKCKMPDNKDVRVGFNAGTCSTWWQARVVEVYTEYQTLLAGWNNEWSLDGPSDNYKISCATGAGTAFAAFGASTNSADNDVHPVGPDEIWQYRKGNMYLYTNTIQNHATWASATETQRQRFARNTIRHEFGHLFGLGHLAGSPCNNLMCEYQTTFSSLYTENKFLVTSDQDRMRCYNEDSGTTDDC